MTRCARLAVFMLVALATGCMSPYYADRGALFGGATGAGVGALVGNAVGDTGAGAVIGAGVGALTGAAVGSSLDSIEARNRAEIAARTGRPVPAGVVTVPDVVSMSQAGVDPQVIANHIRTNGAAAPLTSADLIYLEQQKVDPSVVQALQSGVRPVAYAAPVAAPVVVDPYYYPPPPVYYPAGYYCWGPPPPRYSVGVSYNFGRGGRCR